MYLEPERQLEEFAAYIRTEAREEFDDKFVHTQLGFMASAMKFLGRTMAERPRMVGEQRTGFVAACDEMEALLDDAGLGEEELRETIANAREAVHSSELSRPADLERAITTATAELLSTVDELDEEYARELRAPLYEVMDRGIELQLDALGRGRD